MLSVSVHKDIGEYTEKVVGKLSARTLACTAGGLVTAVAVLGDGKLGYATGSHPASIAGPVGCAKIDRRARRASKRKGAERHVLEL